MKKMYYIILLLLGVSGCHDNADYSFQGKDAVYFQLNTSGYNWKTTLDSLIYTFAGKGVEQDTLWIRVNLAGNITQKARPVVVIVDEQKTTAEVGLHYEALKAEYDLPGNSVYMNIPVIIYKKDKELENKKVEIALALKATKSLGLGITDRLNCRLIVSNMLNKPSYWDSNIHYHFGSYSRKKHELCIQVLGKDFPEKGSDYVKNPDYNTWKVYGRYMSNYFEENYPVYDEDNIAIEPW